MAPLEGRTADCRKTPLTSPRRGDLHREAESDEDSSPATKGAIKHMLLEMRQGNGGYTEQAPSGGVERQCPGSPAASH
ncbi:Hypothetical predicted protein [Pelobates cultripes]|uniref:Uncharacterized protein n=1 Tax=Pelobates cultripes TaxID=61616 RepID=A0AAD1T4R9_PELCU|nr:Hypothetical predicted protein [Pelobates cultripes]